MDYNFQKTKSGFSMIELLIVVAIALIMTAALFVSRNGNKASSDVEAASREVAAQIRSLQNESLSGKKIGTNYASRYHFKVTGTAGAPSPIYTISYENSAGTNLLSMPPVNLTKKRVKFVSSADFYFQSPRGEINPAGNYMITLQSNDESANAYICVSSTGNVVEQQTATCP